MNEPSSTVTVTLIGGPTALIEVGGLRLLTDPTFSLPGPQSSGTATLVKLTGPALTPEQVEPLDAVLLSHDQHSDNLDAAGRDLLPTVPAVLTTTDGAGRLGGNSIAVEPWHHVSLERPGKVPLTVTAVPAHHGPDGTEASSGQVIGFVLSADDIPTIYVSGDNASLRVVEDVAHHLGPIEIAVLFAGAARTPRIDAYVTLTSDQVVDAARILDARAVIPIHTEGWAPLTESPAAIVAAFERAGLSDRLRLPVLGQPLSV